MTDEQYKSYVGQYVKRFYAPFKKERIAKIKDFRNVKGYAEYLYAYDVSCGHDYQSGDYWLDCEDSCIITNELPIKELDWVANINDPQYKGFNPFSCEKP